MFHRLFRFFDSAVNTITGTEELYNATPYDYLKKLHDREEAVNLTKNYPVAKLMSAVRAGNLSEVKNLIENEHMPVDSIEVWQDRYREDFHWAETPLIAAICAKQWQIAGYLLEHKADANLQTGKITIGENAVDCKMLYAMTALHLLADAAKESPEAMALFKYAVEKNGCTVNQVDLFHHTPCHYAIKSNNEDLFDYCLAQPNIDIEVVLGSDADTQWYGDTLLGEAAACNRIDMAKKLLARGADVDGGAELYKKTPPLFRAASNYYGTPMLQLLEAHGAKMHLTSYGERSQTAMHAAIQCGSASNVEFLLKHDVSLYSEDTLHLSPWDNHLEKVRFAASGYRDKHGIDARGAVYPSSDLTRVIEMQLAKEQQLRQEAKAKAIKCFGMYWREYDAQPVRHGRANSASSEAIQLTGEVDEENTNRFKKQ